MSIQGKAHKYGEDINTDLILPGRYLNVTDAKDLGKHCMEDFDKGFCGRVKEGDIIVGRKNFGCGSSREHAPVAIMANGISCVIADSFARIFYRNAINIGLPLIECPELAEITADGDILEVQLTEGKATNVTKGKTFNFKKYPDFMLEILDAGGLVEYTNKII